MLTLLVVVVLSLLVFLAGIGNYNSGSVLVAGASLNYSLSDPCREARGLENLVTVGLIHEPYETFCPAIIPLQGRGGHEAAKGHCCSGSWTPLFPQSWARLANTFNVKMSGMEAGLKNGIENIKGMNCPPSNLQATTLTVLNQLANGNKWIQLLNSTTSPECRLKVVQAIVCPGVCEPSLSLSPPCRGFCVNTLRGCVSDLTKLVIPWKHAMNSIRTAVRLLGTKENSGCLTPNAADTFVNSLTTWREPLQWLDSGCEEMPQDNCFNGKDVSAYTKTTAPLGSSSNPEFPFSEVPNGINKGKSDVIEFKSVLENVVEELSHHWPRLPDEPELEEDGSGLGSGHTLFNTDDEDLLSNEYGSGSGDGVDPELRGIGEDSDTQESINESNNSKPSEPSSHPKSPSTPTKTPTNSQSPGSGSSSIRPNFSLNSNCLFIFFIFGASILRPLLIAHNSL